MTYTLHPPLPPTSTPPDYHRVHFDPSHLSSKRIVGLLACQRDPLLRKLQTIVVNCHPASITAPPPQRGKGNKKKHDPSLTVDPTAQVLGRLWEFEVEDTVIFPEGGGQPSDTGTLWIVDANGTSHALSIEGCLRRKLDSVHLVRLREEDEHLLDNVMGREVELEVNWDRRQDHMAIHTAQHLLSAVLDTYSLPTLSWSLTSHPSLEPPYIELSRKRGEGDVARVESVLEEFRARYV
ncbi:MAG: hypothetical protein TREMPRED_001491 [Tremellales sp. Tagirdzhanova-0007]|nr:MAG: hypothetical protein TREMPRED_001491 [Tremellales sp. Tagirdzhanova-0007]